MKDLVSVIIPTYNSEKYIKYAVDSIIKQTYQKFEIIIIDDCSTDNTIKIINEIKDKRIRLFTNDSNRGPSYSRNRGISISQGKWIALLDSDDYWAEVRLERLLQMAQQKDVEIICDDLYLVKNEELSPYNTYLNSRVNIIGKIHEPVIINAKKMVSEDYGFLQPLIRREFLSDTEVRYKENIRNGEDFRFILDCLLLGAEMLLLPEPMYFYRQHEASLTKIEGTEQQITSIEELIDLHIKNKELIKELKEYRRKKRRLLLDSKLVTLYEQKKIFNIIFLILIKPDESQFFIRKMVKGALKLNGGK